MKPIKDQAAGISKEIVEALIIIRDKQTDPVKIRKVNAAIAAIDLSNSFLNAAQKACDDFINNKGMAKKKKKKVKY